MSEVDVHGTILCSYTDVNWPRHLLLDSEGHVLIADHADSRILLLNSQLQLQRVLVNANSEIMLLSPVRLCYNELTSQLYVLHASSKSLSPKVISLLRLR